VEKQVLDGVADGAAAVAGFRVQADLETGTYFVVSLVDRERGGRRVEVSRS
jgi:hypothetical protein